MTSGWILILVFSHQPTGAAMTTAQYTTEAACRAAGEATARKFLPNVVQYTCTAR